MFRRNRSRSGGVAESRAWRRFDLGEIGTLTNFSSEGRIVPQSAIQEHGSVLG